jgi:tetratricopeptide (TPR) repeat protein
MHRLRRTGFFGVTIFLLSALLAQTTNQIQAIGSALQAKQFDKALDLLHPALKSSPENAELWAMQGTAYAGLRQKKEALDSFQRSLKISPDYLPALKGAIQIEYQAGSKDAIPLLQRMLRLDPSDPVSHGMLAVLEYQRGNCKSAVFHFEKAGALFDAQPSGLKAYGSCWMRLQQPAKAADVFERALYLNPKDERERRLLASVQLLANLPENALRTLAPLLQARDPQPDTLELAATAYEQKKDTPEAVNTLRRAILLAPQNMNLYLDFANLSYAHDSFQVGIDVVSDGINLQPMSAPLYFARGVLYVQLARYDKGEADFEKAYQLDPSQSLSSAALGLAAAQQNDLDHALASVEASLRKKPNDAILLYLQAEILSEKGAEPGTAEFTRALRSASKAVELQPNLAPPRAVLATLYLQAGRYKEAVEQCRRALQSDPKNQTALYHLIQALRKTGENREIPDLLKRLALLRKEAARDQSQRYQYKLVEEDSAPK